MPSAETVASANGRAAGGAHIVLRANGHEDRMTLSDDGLKMTGVSWVTNFTVPFSVHKRQ
jgi:hypothetical protein